MLKRTFIAAIAGAALAAVFTTPSMAQAEKLRVGVEGNYPPFSKIAPDGKLEGFDIDIANAVCAQMKARVHFVQQEFDGIIPALNAKKFDMIVASMTITRRAGSRSISPIPIMMSLAFRREAGRFHGSFAGGAQGQEDRGAAQFAARGLSGRELQESEIVLAGKETEVYMELAVGRADVAFGSTVVSGEASFKKPKARVLPSLAPRSASGPALASAIAVRMGEEAFVGKINAALKAIKADGTYKKLADKYFDFDISGS